MVMICLCIQVQAATPSNNNKPAATEIRINRVLLFVLGTETGTSESRTLEIKVSQSKEAKTSFRLSFFQFSRNTSRTDSKPSFSLSNANISSNSASLLDRFKYLSYKNFILLSRDT